MQTAGIHHVTAMAADPQRNRDFYEGVLGLRLVKQTVNFDDPATYHLYYGDGVGSPGTILTFFPIPGLRPGTRGAGTTERVALGIPVGAAPAWRARLDDHHVAVAERAAGDGRDGLVVADPDGLEIALVESAELVGPRVWGARVGSEMAIQGIDGVQLASAAASDTARVLGVWLGLQQDDHGDYRAGDLLGGRVRVRDAAGALRTRLGAGIVHHIAFRSTSAGEQRQWADHVRRHGALPTPVQDREYFTSIYFHEPGGVLLEIATDGPGFTRDEPFATLGEALCLPPWLEVHRDELRRHLVGLDSAPQEAPR
jgi:glyoxalase family protein